MPSHKWRCMSLIILGFSQIIFSCKTRKNQEPSSEVLASDKGDIALKSDKFFDIKHVIKIEITSPEWEQLRTQQPKGGKCNFEFTGANYDWFHATELKIDGVQFNDAGIKKRSFCNSLDDKKPALAINISKFNANQKDQALQTFGVSSLGLSNSKQDPTYIRQCLAYQLFAEAGIAGPRCNYAVVTVNGQEIGLYINIEGYNERWAERHYGSAGSMYELAGEAWEWWAMDRLKAHKEFGEDDAMNEVKNLITALKDDKGPDLATLANFVDFKQYIDYWAMEIIMIHWDAMARGNNNSYAYFGTDGKLRIAPWGTDQVYTEWGNGEDRQVYKKNFVAERLYNSKHKAQFDAAVWRLLDKFDPNTIYAKIYNLEQILKPYEHLIDRGSSDWSMKKMKDLIWNRKNTIQTIIPRP